MLNIIKKMVSYKEMLIFGSMLIFSFGAMAAGNIAGTDPPIKAGKPYAGTTITVPSMKGWASFAPAVDLTKNFTKMTGIKVVYDMTPGADGLMKKELLSMKKGRYNLIQVHGEAYGNFFRYLEPMTDRIKEAWGSVKAFEDSFFPVQDGVKGKDGKHYWIPFHANAQIGYYRKNLFEDPKEKAKFRAEYGYPLQPPATRRQLEDIAKFFTRPSENLYGLTANWGGACAFTTVTDYYHSTGHSFLDENFRPTMKSGSGRRDFKIVIDWMQNAIYRDKFVNTDSIRFCTGQVSDFFISGSSAMAYGWLSDYWAFMQKPKNQKKSGPVGAFTFPSLTGVVPGGYASWWTMGIPKDSPHPDAAWEYIKWMLQPSPQIEMAGGQLPPSKKLAWEVAVDPGKIMPQALYYAFANARLSAQVPEMTMQPMTQAKKWYQKVMANKMSSDEFVDKYAKVIEKTMKKAGYYK